MKTMIFRVCATFQTNIAKLVLEQESEIRNEIARSSALVGPVLPLSEYTEGFKAKVDLLQDIWRSIRKIRPDGNCFYRAYLFGLFERSISASDLNELRDKFENLGNVCIDAGYDSFAIDDFKDMILEQIDEVSASPSVETLEQKIFSDPSIDGYLIAFMRCICGATMKLNASDFEAVLPPAFSTVDNFVRTEVNPMFKDCEEMQIVALCRAMKVPIRIVYLDNSAGIPSVHAFGDEAEGPPVCLLYRPGHYDLIYS